MANTFFTLTDVVVVFLGKKLTTFLKEKMSALSFFFMKEDPHQNG